MVRPSAAACSSQHGANLFLSRTSDHLGCDAIASNLRSRHPKIEWMHQRRFRSRVLGDLIYLFLARFPLTRTGIPTATILTASSPHAPTPSVAARPSCDGRHKQITQLHLARPWCAKSLPFHFGCRSYDDLHTPGPVPSASRLCWTRTLHYLFTQPTAMTPRPASNPVRKPAFHGPYRRRSVFSCCSAK